MKPIVCCLMQRLASFLADTKTSSADTDGLGDLDVFTLFRTPLTEITSRALTAGSEATGADIANAIEIQAAFMAFTTSLYPNKIQYVDLILKSTTEMLRNVVTADRLSGQGAQKLVDLLAAPMKSLSLKVLEMEYYPELVKFLEYQTRKQA